MLRTLLATAMLCAWPLFAHAQNIRSGTIGGMPYQVLMPATACTASNPCGVVVYLGYQDASYHDATTALQNYFAGDTSLHAIVIAPTITASQDYNKLGWLRADQHTAAAADGGSCPGRRGPDGQYG